MSGPTLTAVIHGESGVGKTHLGITTPAPRLIVDAEGGTQWVDGKKVSWNPLTEKPPSMDDVDTCVVTVRDFQTLTTLLQWLQSGQHPFKSVVLDSLTEIQKRCLDNIVGTEQARTQDWGELLRKMEKLVRDMRDMTMNNGHSLTSVIFICGTQIKDGTAKPHVQGQLALTLPYFVDVMGYLYVEAGDGGLVRKLLVAPINGIAAKDRTGKLGVSIENPNITTMLDQLMEVAVNG